MEPPTSLEAKALRVEKNKVFEAMKPLKPYASIPSKSWMFWHIA